MPQLVDHLWDNFGARTFTDLDDAAVAIGRHSIMDWFGCGLAGASDHGLAMVVDEVEVANGPCRLIGTERRSDRVGAALANGAAGHALDYDDTSPLVGGHVTVTVLPALLAAADELGSTQREILEAFVIGSEIQCRIGIGMGPRPQQLGWHPSGITGPFGAAAAVAHLLGLDRVEFGQALGMAASTTGGHRANFGSMTKPLHAGFAAQRGLLAARLASRGFTAHENAVDEVLLALGSEEIAWGRLDKWADRWAVPKTLFKYHAACHLAHPGVDALNAALGQLADVRAPVGDVEQVTVIVDSYALGVCQFSRPTTGHEAKFSLEGTLALALCGFDTAVPSTFDDANVVRPDVQDAIDRVTVETDDSLTHMQSQVRVRHGSGEVESSADLGLPSNIDEQGARLGDKFEALASGVIGAEQAAAAHRLLADFGRDDVGLDGIWKLVAKA